MAKVTKGLFVKPTEQEVFEFINSIMIDWPERFCRRMAEKFWQTYQSRGWTINGRLMKDWKAAWHARWKHLTYKEDRDFLETCLNDMTHKAKMAQRDAERDGMFAAQYGTATVGSEKPAFYYLEFYQKMMESYFQGQVPEKDLWKHYDRLKSLGIMRLPREQITLIWELMGNDRNYGKSLSVVRLFKNLSEQKMTLKQQYDKVHAEKQPQP